jgi:uncharacterized Rmd1/YagE family protein
LTSYFASNTEQGEGGNHRRSMSQDYGSLPSVLRKSKVEETSVGLSRSVELPSMMHKLSPATDEFSDEISTKIGGTQTGSADKTTNRMGRHFHGSSQLNNLMSSANVMHGSKMIKSGRQRKKIAARSKGGEFQARRKKRRLYFCCISSEIDIEKLADHFLVEVKEEGASTSEINKENLAINPSPIKAASTTASNSGIRTKFPHIRGRMYDEVLYLFTDVSQSAAADDNEPVEKVGSQSKKVHYSSDVENMATSTATVVQMASSNDNDSGTLSPMHVEQISVGKAPATISLRPPMLFPTNPMVNKVTRDYQSNTSGHTSSDGYSSSDNLLRLNSKFPLHPLRNPTTNPQSAMYSIEELSDVDPTPVNSPHSSLYSRTPGSRTMYQTDEEDYDLTPPPISTKVSHQASDSEYYDHEGPMYNQHSDGELTDTGGNDRDLLMMDQDKLRSFRSTELRRGSIDKTEEALKDFQSSAQFWHLGGKEVFIFDFGAIVFWGYQRDEVKELLHEFRQYIVKGRLSEAEFEAGEDDMAFVTSDEATNITIANDVIVIPECTIVQMRLAVSFAIAQSSILSIFEARIEEKIEEYKYIPETLALCGKVKLSQKELGNMIGEVFVIRHDVNLHSEILDIPDYFWKEQAVEPLYRMTMMYLEIEPRTEVVNKRLDLLRELLRLLQHQHENDHAVKLEWIVIWLIVVSVVLELMVIVGKLLNFNIE